MDFITLDMLKKRGWLTLKRANYPTILYKRNGYYCINVIRQQDGKSKEYDVTGMLYTIPNDTPEDTRAWAQLVADDKLIEWR